MRSKMRNLLAIKKYKEDSEAVNRIMKEKGYFYAWHCLSLVIETRTVDFIIPDRSDMLCLVNCLKTVLYRLNMEAGEKT